MIDIMQIAKDLREGRLTIDNPDPLRSAYVYRPYPKVKYHATLEPVTVQSEEDEERLGTAWANSPDEAKAKQLAFDEAIANAAAERAYDDRRLGEKARAELKAYEQDAPGHVLDVPIVKE